MVKSTTIKATIEEPRGGTGKIELYEILTPEEMQNRVGLYAKVVIEPYASIGFHAHENDSESYYVIEGSGFFIDNEQNKIPIKEGDVCLTCIGESHGLINPNDQTLVIIAMVL